MDDIFDERFARLSRLVEHLRLQLHTTRPDDPARELAARALLGTYRDIMHLLRLRAWYVASRAALHSADPVSGRPVPRALEPSAPVEAACRRAPARRRPQRAGRTRRRLREAS